MSGPLILVILAAVGFAGFGLQVVSHHLDRFPLDTRRPGPLVSARRDVPETAHSVELRRLVTVVSSAILNDPSARAELQGVLDDLGAETPALDDTTAGRRQRHLRSERIEEAVADLERRWRVEPAVFEGRDPG